MTIGPVLASEDKLDQTRLTHLANIVLRQLVARVRASDNRKQANGGMVVVIHVSVLCYQWEYWYTEPCVVWDQTYQSQGYKSEVPNEKGTNEKSPWKASQ